VDFESNEKRLQVLPALNTTKMPYMVSNNCALSTKNLKEGINEPHESRQFIKPMFDMMS